MPTRPARLLCVGKNSDLLRTRCAVLSHYGYEAQSATASEAELLLRTQEFDLIIVSAFLDEWEKGRVLSAACKVPTYVLRGLTLAPELLGEVERMLAERSSRSPQPRVLLG
jgi:CheY-like chemotaxis protein